MAKEFEAVMFTAVSHHIAMLRRALHTFSSLNFIVADSKKMPLLHKLCVIFMAMAIMLSATLLFDES